MPKTGQASELDASRARWAGDPAGALDERIWEGTTAFFAGNLMTELLEDKFSVSLLTGAFLSALRHFLKI